MMVLSSSHIAEPTLEATVCRAPDEALEREEVAEAVVAVEFVRMLTTWVRRDRNDPPLRRLATLLSRVAAVADLAASAAVAAACAARAAALACISSVSSGVTYGCIIMWLSLSAVCTISETSATIWSSASARYLHRVMRLGISSRTVCCTLVSSDERRSNFPPELCRPDPETCFSDGERAEGCLPSSGWSEALLEALRERVSDTRTAVGDAGLEHLLTMLGKQRRSSSSSAQPGKWRSRSHARDCCAARLPSSVSCSADRPMPEANDVLASEGRADRTWLGLPSLGGGCFGRDERRVDSCNCGCEPVLESEVSRAIICIDD
mmetsp:Transcript_37364/g.82211  ORF Transcript_37364/g.82211 Transcript_37364/m.82211 type:complete len:321 (-) Transcript_37364:2070-3032(-)